MTSTTSTVTGTCLTESGFTVSESSGEVDLDRAFDVLSGRLAAHIVHDYVDAAGCARIEANFWSSTRRQARHGAGADGVEGYVLGASHIEKPLARYLDEVEANRSAVAELYVGAVDPLSRLRSRLATHRGVGRARPAAHDGRAAADSKAVCWNGIGEHLLEPHEDLAQLGDPRQAEFEISGCEQVTAANFYPSIVAGSGQIKLWNVIPDPASKARLGLEHSGFPYPPDALAGHPSLVLELRRGDLCLMNGNLVHAVLRGMAETPSSARLLVTCFMSLGAGGELLWWT